MSSLTRADPEITQAHDDGPSTLSIPPQAGRVWAERIPNRPNSSSVEEILEYTLARTSGEPLLFKGDDFAKTDIGRVT